MSAWHTPAGFPAVANFNGNENYSAVVVASRDPSFNLNAGNGSLYDICHQNMTQTHCYGPGTTLQQGISFIHSYSGSGTGSLAAPLIRGVDLSGGCGTVSPPDPTSNPYYNVDDGTDCGPILIDATIDFGPVTDPANPDAYPDCIRVTASPGGLMTYQGNGVWHAVFTPAAGSGRNVVNISTQYKKPSAGNCNQLVSGGSFPRVAVPYVSDDDSGIVQYIRLENLDPPGGLANSINGNGIDSHLNVIVGLLPPLRDEVDPYADPIPLRIWNTASQSRTLDCQTNGANGWQDAMEFGCVAYQIYNQAWHTSGCGPPPAGVSPADPPDCIASQNGNYQQSVATDMWASTLHGYTEQLVHADSPPRAGSGWTMLDSTLHRGRDRLYDLRKEVLPRAQIRRLLRHGRKRHQLPGRRPGPASCGHQAHDLRALQDLHSLRRAARSSLPLDCARSPRPEFCVPVLVE